MTSPFGIKICGVTERADAEQSLASGADAIGLNFFSGSRRYLPLKTAKTWVPRLCEESANLDRTRCCRWIGVFVNASDDEMLQHVGELGLDAVQLHGDETPDRLPSLRTSLDHHQPGTRVIRAIRSQPLIEGVPQPGLNRPVEVLAREVEAWSAVGVDAVLLDAAEDGQFGGSGKVFDWSMVPEILNRSRVPVVLAGGLTPSNVGVAIRRTGVEAVDVASGVESGPGRKDLDLVRQFVREARAAWSNRSKT